MSITAHNSYAMRSDRVTQLYAELESLLVAPDEEIGADPRSVRGRWTIGFAANGWACNVPVLGSNLTISYMRNGVGICVQLGNVARTYADLLKLEALYRGGWIEEAVVVVPDDALSKRLGSNHAQFDRLVREVELFRSVITMPILVVGVGY